MRELLLIHPFPASSLWIIDIEGGGVAIIAEAVGADIRASARSREGNADVPRLLLVAAFVEKPGAEPKSITSEVPEDQTLLISTKNFRQR